MSRYKEIEKVINTLPFLQDEIKNQVGQVYDEDHLDEIWNGLLDEYDYDKDIFGLAKTFNYSSYGYSQNIAKTTFSNPKILFLYNLIINSNAYRYSILTNCITRCKYKELFDLCYAALMDLGLDTFHEKIVTNMSQEDAIKQTQLQHLISDFYRITLSYFSRGNYIYKQPDVKEIDLYHTSYALADIAVNGTANIESMLKVYSLLRKHYYESFYGSSAVSYFSDICNQLTNVVKTVYEVYTDEHITETLKIFEVIENIFKIHKVDYIREKSIFNQNLSSEFVEESIKQYKTIKSLEDIENKCIEVLNENSDSTIRTSNVVDVIFKYVINNNYIKDKIDPEHKRYVTSNFLYDIIVKLKKQPVEIFYTKLKKYLYEPYFITRLAFTNNVILEHRDAKSQATRRFLAGLIKYANKETLLQFVNDYFTIIKTDVEKRIPLTAKTTANFITYGTLDYLWEEYIVNTSKDILNDLVNELTTSAIDNKEYDKLLLLTIHKQEFRDYSNRNLIDYSQDTLSKILRSLISDFKDNCHRSWTISNSRKNKYTTCVTVNRKLITYRLMNYLQHHDEYDVFFENEENSYSDFNTCLYKNDHMKTMKNLMEESDFKDLITTAFKTLFIQIYSYLADFIYDTYADSENILSELKDFLIPDKNIILCATSDLGTKPDVYGNNKEGYIKYLSVSGLLFYHQLLNLNTKYQIGLSFTIPKDTVFIPEYPQTVIRYDDKKTKIDNEILHLSSADFAILRPLFYDNMVEDFDFDHSMKTAIFDIYNYVVKELKHSYSYRYSAICRDVYIRYGATVTNMDDCIKTIYNFYEKLYSDYYQGSFDTEVTKKILENIQSALDGASCMQYF